MDQDGLLSTLRRISRLVAPVFRLDTAGRATVLLSALAVGDIEHLSAALASSITRHVMPGFLTLRR